MMRKLTTRTWWLVLEPNRTVTHSTFQKYYSENEKEEQYPPQLEDEYLEYMVQEMNRLQNSPNFEQLKERQGRDLEENDAWMTQFLNEQEQEAPKEQQPKAAAPKAPAPALHAEKPASEPFDLDDLLRGKDMFFMDLLVFRFLCFFPFLQFQFFQRFPLSFSHFPPNLWCMHVWGFWKTHTQKVEKKEFFAKRVVHF